MALDIREIEGIVREAIDKIKKATMKAKDWVNNPPEFHPYYLQSVEDAARVGVHIDKDIIPVQLFKKAAPNETEQELEYRKETYKAVTVPSMHRALNSTYRGFNNNNWSEKYPETPAAFSDEPIKDYFTKDYPGFGSLINYFKQVFTSKKIWHPNGVFVCYPGQFPDKVNEEGEKIVDTSVTPEPIVKIFDTDKIIDYKDNVYFFGLTEEKSIVKFGNDSVRDGLIFEFYDDTYIYRVIQVGKKVDWTFEIELIYQHDLGYVPCDKLKGIVKDVTEYGKYYESYFGSAIPLLEEALRDASTLQVVKVRQAYPVRWKFEDNCNYEGCVGGYIHSEEGPKPCPKCSDKNNRHSPMNDVILRMSDRFSAGDTQLPTPPFGFVAPPTEVMAFLRQEIKENIINAWAALNIDVSNSNPKGSDTALKAQIDREELFSFLLQFFSEIFDAYHFCVQTLGRLRYMDKWDSTGYELHPPQTFDIRTENERIAEIAEGRKEGLSPMVIGEMEGEFIDTRFNGNVELGMIMSLARKLDRLFGIQAIDIQAKLATRTAERWEVILHDSAYSFIQDAIDQDEDFLNKDFAAQKETIINAAKAKAAEMEPATNAQSILEEANADTE